MTTARFNMPLSGIDPPVKKRAAIAPSPISIIYWQILCQYIPQRQCAGWLQRLDVVDGDDRAGDTERGVGAEHQQRRIEVARRAQPPDREGDRKSVVSGRTVTVRADLGGGRSVKKK